MKDDMLTIGIPTYNRKEMITKHVEGLIAAFAHDIVNILIIDNNSPDGTFEHLKTICGGTSIRVLKNPQNLGFTGNIVRIFQECQTEYLIITSDEDPLILTQLDSLVTFLHKRKPLFVSPKFFLTESNTRRLYRGKESVNRISPCEFNAASFYMSGLVYRMVESKQALANIKFHIGQPGQVYPLVLLTAELLMRGPCFWWG